MVQSYANTDQVTVNGNTYKQTFKPLEKTFLPLFFFFFSTLLENELFHIITFYYKSKLCTINGSGLKNNHYSTKSYLCVIYI